MSNPNHLTRLLLRWSPILLLALPFSASAADSDALIAELRAQVAALSARLDQLETAAVLVVVISSPSADGGGVGAVELVDEGRVEMEHVLLMMLHPLLLLFWLMLISLLLLRLEETQIAINKVVK